MASLNRVFILGNLTKDPELRRIPSGTAVTELRLAVSEIYKNREGVEMESVCYVDVVAWSATAEACDRHLFKGSPVMIEGRLQYDQWEKDGEKRSRLCVRADRVQFMGQPRERPPVDPFEFPPREESGSADSIDEGEPPPF